MAFPFWKDKRRKEEELLNVPFALRLTHTESEFIKNRAMEECTSQTSIIRKALKRYRNYIESIDK